MQQTADIALPLDDTSGFDRSINITTCRPDKDHIQVRGELIDTRQDFVNPEQTRLVHHVVARITFRLSDHIITDAQFSMPKMAFKGICEKLPASAGKLIGLDAFKNMSYKLKTLFGGRRSCFHIHSLLQAMLPAFQQARSWNNDFKEMDEKLPAQEVPGAMDQLLTAVKNSCHAWDLESGAVPQSFQEGQYGLMLERTTPRLLGRWKQQNNDEQNDT